MNVNEYYLSRYTYDRGRVKVWKAICKYLQKYINDDSSIVDIGAGYCDFINNINAKFKYAVDVNKNSEKYCNQDVKFYSSVNNLQNALVSSFSISLESNNRIDVVFISNLLEHLNDTECSELLKSINSILKEQGKLIIIQPNYYYSYKNYWDDYTHIKAYSHTSLCDLLIANDFKIERCEKRFLPFTMKSLFPKTYFLTRLYLALPFHPFAKQMLVIATKKS